MLLTISNLYPRPDELRRGLFNAQLFSAMNQKSNEIVNICTVPDWKVWRHQTLSRWKNPYDTKLETHYSPYFYMPIVGRSYSWTNCFNSLKQHKYLFEQCEAVLATWLYPDCVAAVEMARMCQKPVWLKVHGTDRFHLKNSVRRRLILHACEYAEGVICNAEFMKSELVKLGIPSGKVHVVQNGVDASLFTLRDKKQAAIQLYEQGYTEVLKQVTDSRSEIILFVGHLVDIKGADILLDAFAELRHAEVDVARHLVVIGDGARKKCLKDQAVRLGVDDSVSFLGDCAHNEVSYWMNVADCLCLPSRSEGMPNVIFEALVSGLPVVATDVGDCNSVLCDESLAVVVATEDHHALAKGLSELLDMQVDRSALASRQQQRGSWGRSAEQHLSLLQLAVL